VRLLVKQIGADRLLTLTTRQNENTPEELCVHWRKLVRSLAGHGYNMAGYVAVPERHPTNPGHWHLHVAVRGYVPVNVVRGCWWHVLGGRGNGNIDVKYIKVRAGLPTGARAARVAAYISKYISKELLSEYRPDKKNYWRSVFQSPAEAVHRLNLRSDGIGLPFDLGDMVRELRDRFGIDLEMASAGTSRGVFFFPDGSGFWYHSMAGAAQPPPPF
jgi:hypothetical protein